MTQSITLASTNEMPSQTPTAEHAAASSNENYEDFLKRDQMELDFGIGTVISLSDKIIINEKDLESYEKEINEFLKENTTL